MRFIMMITLFAGWTMTTGCVSAVDEGCTSDSQCYAGRVCVDGRCTGEVTLAQNNVSNVANNESNLSNVANNQNNVGNNRNGDPNNANNVNGDPNNANVDPNNELACNVSEDCEDGEVCSAPEPGGDELSCTEAWFCEPAFFEANEFECFAEWFCEDDRPLKQIYCEFDDRDTGRCYCFTEPDVDVIEFEASRGWCGPDGLAELANIRCGWQIPTTSF